MVNVELVNGSVPALHPQVLVPLCDALIDTVGDTVSPQALIVLYESDAEDTTGAFQLSVYVLPNWVSVIVSATVLLPFAEILNVAVADLEDVSFPRVSTVKAPVDGSIVNPVPLIE